MPNNKQFLYVGHYIATSGEYVFKIGTTNNLKRRSQEHTRMYKKCKNYPLQSENEFVYDWSISLSKSNTLKYEDENKAEWQKMVNCTYIRNDRFVFSEKPTLLQISIRKTYTINL